MYSCDKISISGISSSIKQKKECNSFLKDILTIQKVESQDSQSVTVRAEDNKNKNSLSLKIIHDLDLGLKELQALCHVKEAILDRKLSPCFMRCDFWTVCSRLPEIDKLEPSNIENFSPEDPYLYLLLNTADFSLSNLPYQPTQYEVKCLTFELLYSIQVAHKITPDINLDLREDRILVTYTNIDRIYTIDEKQFRVSSRYLPLLNPKVESIQGNRNKEVKTKGDITKEESKEVKIKEKESNFLLETLAYFINSKVDLSDIFVQQFGNLKSVIKDFSKSNFFDDLTVKPRESEVAAALKRDKSVIISPLEGKISPSTIGISSSVSTLGISPSSTTKFPPKGRRISMAEKLQSLGVQIPPSRIENGKK